MLAAETSEFELTLAKARHELFQRRAAGTDASGAPVVDKQATTTVRSLRTARPPPTPVAPVARVTRVTPVTRLTPLKPQASQGLASASRGQAGRLTLRHLLESWKVKQSRHRTIQTFETAVNEFHVLHGPLAAEDITRSHARRYRDVLVERRLSDGTFGNRLGFLGTLLRFGQVELIEHVLGNPFERIPVNGGKRQRAAKDRRAYSVAELNVLFSSKLYTHVRAD